MIAYIFVVRTGGHWDFIFVLCVCRTLDVHRTFLFGDIGSDGVGRRLAGVLIYLQSYVPFTEISFPEPK